MFLIAILLWTSSALAIYSGDPWKLKFYQHIPLLVIFILDLIAGTTMYFITDLLAKPFSFKAIPINIAAIILAIISGCIFCQQLYNIILNRLVLNKRIIG